MRQLQHQNVRVHVAWHEFARPTFASARLVTRILDDVRPHILHINDYCGVLLPLCARLRGTKVVYHLRTAPLSEDIVDVLMNCDHIICVSDYVAGLARTHGVPTSVLDVVYDGVDVARWKPVCPEQRSAAKRRLGIDAASTVVLMVARYSPNKRHDLLVQAMAPLIGDSRLHLVLVGESFGQEQRGWECHIESLLARTGVGAVTTRLGFQSDIHAVQEAADIAVLCSEEEPLGTSILEAMALGLPVVVSNKGGLRELVGAHRRTGLVVPHGEVQLLSDAIRMLVDDSGLRTAMGEQARAACLEHCTLAHCATSVMDVYRNVLRFRSRTTKPGDGCE